NVNYVRTMLGCFSCNELRAMDIKSLDMLFLHQCYEGEAISIRKRETAEGFEAGILNGEGVLAFAAAVK
ncbi:MAG: hypothetical protein GX860_11010, partial [Alcaligenaceae bacterium]|nr:hypothetical protein [Alcaligenaceae bacterium]